MTEDPDEPLAESSGSGAEWHQCDTCCVVFPFGVDYFAQESGALAVRIAHKTGDLEILTEVGKAWRDVAKAHRSGALAAVK